MEARYSDEYIEHLMVMERLVKKLVDKAEADQTSGRYDKAHMVIDLEAFQELKRCIAERRHALQREIGEQMKRLEAQGGRRG